MAVSITGIYNDIASDLSRRVAVTSGSTLADIIAGIETVLTSSPGGWSIHDASAGTNAKCYKSLQKDGTSYTYMVLDWNTTISTGVAGLIVRLYEDWNNSTHAGTNKAENIYNPSGVTLAEREMGQRLPYDEADPWQIDVHVLPGGAAFFASREASQVSSNAVFSGSPTYGGATYVAECLRENSGTLPVGTPAAVWSNAGQMPTAANGFCHFNPCRIFDGRTKLYSGFIAPGIAVFNPASNLGTYGYTSSGGRRVTGYGGVPYVSSITPCFSVSNSVDNSLYAEFGPMRGVLLVGPSAGHSTVWSVETDSDRLPVKGGTARNFRCYGSTSGAMRILFPL